MGRRLRLTLRRKLMNADSMEDLEYPEVIWLQEYSLFTIFVFHPIIVKHQRKSNVFRSTEMMICTQAR